MSSLGFPILGFHTLDVVDYRFLCVLISDARAERASGNLAAYTAYKSVLRTWLWSKVDYKVNFTSSFKFNSRRMRGVI